MLLTLGCKVGPDYVRPAAIENCRLDSACTPTIRGAECDQQQWWRTFNDPCLDGLIRNVLAQNLTLREAGHRIIEARARLAVVRGEFFPQYQALEASYAKARISSTTANFFSQPGVFEPALNVENWNVGFTTSWELDFWGRYRRMIESADATLEATIATHDDVKVLLLAETAKAYVQIRTFEHRKRLAQQNIDIQQRILSIVKRKKEAGLATGIDLNQAEGITAQTESLLSTFEILRIQASHRLCVLLGRCPQDLASELGVANGIPRPAQQSGYCISADLVRRRPDVRRAERELAAQSARIGVAVSEFYPHISLNGNIGYQSEDLGKLFQASSSVGAIQPRMTWNILNYCRIKSNVAAEKAAFCALSNSYQQAALTGLREAEDAQIAFVLSHDKSAALDRAVTAYSTAIERAEKAYEEGATDFTRVSILQSELVLQQDQLAETDYEIATNLISLYQALGGGWQTSANGPWCMPPCELAEVSETNSSVDPTSPGDAATSRTAPAEQAREFGSQQPLRLPPVAGAPSPSDSPQRTAYRTASAIFAPPPR